MTSEATKELLSQGLAASAAGRTKEALALLGNAAAQPGSNGTVWLLLAAEYAAAGQIEQAEAAFAESVLRSPDLAIARYQLGLLQLTSGRAAVALLTWQPLLERSPEDELHAYVRGYVAMVQDRFEEATECFFAGLEVPQSNEALRNDIRRTLAAMASRSEQSTPADASDEGSAPTLTAEQQFLLANYTAGRSH